MLIFKNKIKHDKKDFLKSLQQQYPHFNPNPWLPYLNPKHFMLDQRLQTVLRVNSAVDF